MLDLIIGVETRLAEVREQLRVTTEARLWLGGTHQGYRAGVLSERENRLKDEVEFLQRMVNLL